MMNQILTQYVNLCNLDKVKKTTTGWIFRCFICGDSKKHKNKRRGKILVDSDKIIYYCHNCGSSMGFNKFLKLHKPHLYQEYRLETFKQKMMSKGEWVDHTNNLKDDDDEEPVKLVTWTDNLLNELDDVDDHYDAIEYLRSRKLPEAFINELYFSNHYIKFLTDHNLKHIENVDKIKTDPRIVIPVYGMDKKITHLQGRAMNNDGIRYLTCDLIPEAKKIWGLDRIDINKPVFMFEGVFDAVFVDNAVAGLGSFIDFKYLQTVVKNKLIYCPDSDFRKNVHLEKNLINLVNNGVHIFFTPKDIKEKDINEMIQVGRKKDEIETMINKNTFGGPMAMGRIKFMKIRKY